MSIIAILFPDFSLIVIGFLLARFTSWGTPFWAGLERRI